MDVTGSKHREDIYAAYFAVVGSVCDWPRRRFWKELTKYGMRDVENTSFSREVWCVSCPTDCLRNLIAFHALGELMGEGGQLGDETRTVRLQRRTRQCQRD